MTPDIRFHSIARVELTPIETFEATPERPAFATRDLTLIGEDGTRFRISLFGATADGLLDAHERKRKEAEQAKTAAAEAARAAERDGVFPFDHGDSTWPDVPRIAR